MKHIYMFVIVGLGGIVSSCNQHLSTDVKTPLNIVLINLDDAGNGDFSFKGAIDYQTPNIDKLAAEGMQMTNFYAVQPISGASRAGLMTGCYPNRIGLPYALSPHAKKGINPEEETIAELLKEKGYATAIFGKWHLGDAKEFLPLQHGFDEYYGLPYSNDMWPYHPLLKFPDLPLMEGNDVLEYNTDQTQLTTSYTERSVDFIKRQVAVSKPFFLYLAHSMPHVPLAVSDKFKGKSRQGLYGDVMMELDWSVGEVMRTIREVGVEENTLVILTSDNGPWIRYGNYAGNTGGLREGKATTFNGGMRVPCIFYWKDEIDKGRVCNDLMSNIDILPTIVELTGASRPKLKIDGLSMASTLKGETQVPIRKSLWIYYLNNSLEAVTDGTYKLVFPHEYYSYEMQVPGNDGNPGELGTKEFKECALYDLRRDPGERVNIIKQAPDVLARMNTIAEEARKELGDDLQNIPERNKRKPGKVE